MGVLYQVYKLYKAGKCIAFRTVLATQAGLATGPLKEKEYAEKFCIISRAM